jgi:hypothetical protein
MTTHPPRKALEFLSTQPQNLGAAFQHYWSANAPAAAALPPHRQGRQLLCGLRLLAANQGDRRFGVLCRRLARHLQSCGIVAEEYDIAGAALLASLRDTLGGRFDEAAEAYWGRLYGEAAEAMLASVRRQAGNPA